MKYKKIVIGIDESYTRTGLSIAVGPRTLLKVTSTNFKGSNTNSEKRKAFAIILHKWIKKAQSEAQEVEIICERIRTFTGGSGLRPNYLKSTGALIATIVDVAADYGLPVYSVDTRSWKSQIVGSSKGGKDPTVHFIESLGFDLYMRTNKKGELIYDDDAADSGGIALYGFLPPARKKLKKEE